MKDLESQVNNAFSLLRSGDLMGAEAAFSSVLTFDSEEPYGLFGLGLVAYEKKDYIKAVELLKKVVIAQPKNTKANFFLGLSYQTKGDFEKALAAYTQVLKLKPDFSEALVCRGDVCRLLFQYGQAKVDYDRALELSKNSYRAFFGRALVYSRWKNSEATLTDYTSALKLVPDSVDILINRAGIYCDDNQFELAFSDYIRALQIELSNIELLNSLGVFYFKKGDLDRALDYFNKALRLNPENINALFSRASIYLLRQNFTDGFKDFLVRVNLPRFAEEMGGVLPGLTKETMLSRNKELEGKKILVCKEQGLGDNVQFIRYICCLVDKGAQVFLLMDDRLNELLQSLPWPWQPYRVGMKYDYWTTPLCLTSFFSTDEVFTINSYLLANDKLIDFWRERLNKLGEGLRVGISWRGGATKLDRLSRSIDEQVLKTLLSIKGCTFINLQYDCDRQELDHINAVNSFAIFHMDAIDLKNDVSNLAALMTALDLIITVDNTTAHLAGALGLPAYLLLPKIPNWRWLLDGGG